MTIVIEQTDWGRPLYALKIVLNFCILLLMSNGTFGQTNCPSGSRPKVTPSVISPFCKGSATGAIVMTTEKDKSLYIFNWLTPDGQKLSGVTIVGLSAGQYALTVTETGNVCDTTLTVTVPEGKDLTPPTITCRDTVKQLDSVGTTLLKIEDIILKAEDNCGLDTIYVNKTIFDCKNIGLYQDTIFAEDTSGNRAFCVFRLTIKDTIPPKAKCKNVTAELNRVGELVLEPTRFDDGSTDNCGLLTFNISKTTFNCADIGEQLIMMTVKDASENASSCSAKLTVKDTTPPVLTCPPNITRQLPSGACSDTVSFKPTLADNCTATLQQIQGLISGSFFPIGIMPIQFKATDPSGNTTTCGFTIQIIEYPASGAMSCVSQVEVTLNALCQEEIEAKNYLVGERYRCMDNYRVSLFDGSRLLPDNILRAAQIGRTITYKITDLVSSNACTGRITVADRMPPQIERPSDRIITCQQVLAGGSPSVNLTGEPRILSECSPLAPLIWRDDYFQTSCTTPFTQAPVGFPTDVVFDAFKARNCSRIIVRTFTVRDIYGNATQTKQVIYIRDADLFEIVCPPGISIKCTGQPVNLLPDSVLQPNGTFIAGTGYPRFVNGDPLSYGSCRITFTYSDDRWDLTDGSYFIHRKWFLFNECSGKRDTCIQTIIVEDGLPQVWCRTGRQFSIGINRHAKVEARDLVASVFDKCTPLERMTVRIRRVGQGSGLPDSTALTFGCDAIGTTQNVEIWIRDETGRVASCTTTFTINDSEKNCSPPVPLFIAGSIAKENGTAVTADALLIQLKDNIVQLANPAFKFHNLKKGENYRIEVQRPADWTNGVTTFDIALLSRHILGIETLNSPYKRFAADIDRDGDINGGDMLLMRRLILRLTDTIIGNRPWSFLPKSFTFADPEFPVLGLTDERYTFTNLQDSVTDADFIAVKLGDVNLSARATRNIAEPTERREALQFKMDDILLIKNNTYEIRIPPPTNCIGTSSVAPTFSAIQGTFLFKNSIIEKIESEGFEGFSPQHYAILKHRNAVTFSWDGIIKPDKTWLTLTLKALSDTPLSQALTLTSDLTESEVYTPDGTPYAMQLNFSKNNKITGETPFAFEPPYPNPFQSETTLTFHLPKDDFIEMTVFDLTGKIVKTQSGHFNKGKNTLKMTFEQPITEGVLLCRLACSAGVITQRLVMTH